jgi:hypothetical protein
MSVRSSNAAEFQNAANGARTAVGCEQGRAITIPRIAVLAVLLCSSLSALAQENSPRKIVVACPLDRPPTMNDIRLAIEHSDYTVSLHARLEMLARTRAFCVSRPTGELTWLPPDEMSKAQVSDVAAH